jgi:hypothetical protein
MCKVYSTMIVRRKTRRMKPMLRSAKRMSENFPVPRRTTTKETVDTHRE